MAHTMDAAQLLNVVPPDESALRVTHQIDALAPVLASELFHPVGYDASQFLHRPCVQAAKETSEVDAVGAVSQPTESAGQRANDPRCREKAMH